MTDSIYAWSLTAADNSDADATINWAEFQDPDTVNDSARAMMARIASYIADASPRRTSTGSGNAYAVTSDAAGAALVNGMVICFIADRANTSACTLNVDGLGAKSLRPVSGVDFNAGDILDDQPVLAFYNSSTEEWLALNTGYHVSATAGGLALQNIVASLPKIGDPVLSMDATPAAGRIRLTESTQSVLKTSYPELNTWLSDRSYPWGSTATHFSLPPAAGYFLRFAALTSGIDTSGARTAGSTQSDQNKAHTHTVSGSTDTAADHTHYLAANVNSSTGITATDQMAKQWTVLSDSGYDLTGTATAATLGKSGAAGGHSHSTTGTAASSGGDEVRVKNVAFHVDIIASTAESAAQIAVFGFPYQWDTSTTAGNPGAGRVRGNNATLASVTEIYISNTDRWGQSLAGLFAILASGNSVHLSRVGAGGNRIVMAVNGTPTAGSGYYTIPVTVRVGTGTFSASDNLVLEYGTGGTGPQGIVWEGAWQTATAYAVGDGTSNDGASYICTQAHTSGASTEPGTGASWASYWDVLAEAGTNGTDGDPGLDWQSDWQTSTAYTIGQGVANDGSSYRCKADHTSGAGSEPGTGGSWTTYWDLLAAKGADGAGTGDVVGPSSSVDMELPAFDGTTGKLVQASGVVMLTPEMYGAVGDGTTDDTTAIQNWLAGLVTRAGSAGQALGVMAKKYKITAACNLITFTGHIHVMGIGGASFVCAMSGVTGCIYVSNGAGSGTPTTITTNAAYGDIDIIVASASGMAAGDYIVITNETGYSTETRVMLNRILSVSGTTITLEVPLAFDIDTGETTSVTEYSIGTGTVSFEGVHFDGAGMTGAGAALAGYNLIKPTFRDLSATGFDPTDGAGFAFYNCFGGVFHNLVTEQCGSNGTDAVAFTNITAAAIDNIQAINASGFGIGINDTCACVISNLSATRTTGRSIKLYGACGNSITGIIASHGNTDAVGLGVSKGSSYNQITNLQCLGTPGSAGYGVWCNGTGNSYNVFTNVKVAGHPAGFDFLTTATSPLSDIENTIWGINDDASITVTADTRVLFNNGTMRGLDAVSIRPAANATGGTSTTYALQVLSADGTVSAVTIGYDSTAGLIQSWNGLPLYLNKQGNPVRIDNLELGAASDTTITRAAAGVIAVEGVPLYSNIPQNSQSTAYTLVLGDAQKHILHPSADTTARTFTIPANSSVAYPIGTAITFVNQASAGVVTIAITTDTMRLAGAGTTGSRTLAANGVATALKITSTEWIISGTGLT